MKTPIPDNLDIRRTAAIIIGEHCDDALLYAAMRHGELLENGDVDGCAVWKGVVEAVRELMVEEVPEGETVH